MKRTLKAPGTKRWKLKCDILLSNSAFKFNLRLCNMSGKKAAKAAEKESAAAAAGAAAAGAAAAAAGGENWHTMSKQVAAAAAAAGDKAKQAKRARVSKPYEQTVSRQARPSEEVRAVQVDSIKPSFLELNTTHLINLDRANAKPSQ